MPGFSPDSALVPVFPFLLVQDLSSRFMLSRLSERDCHHHPFKLFSDTHFLSSSYLRVFWAALCPESRSITVPEQKEGIYTIDIIEISRYFVALSKNYKVLHIVTAVCHDIILYIYISILADVASGGKIVANCNDLLPFPYPG